MGVGRVADTDTWGAPLLEDRSTQSSKQPPPPRVKVRHSHVRLFPLLLAAAANSAAFGQFAQILAVTNGNKENDPGSAAASVAGKVLKVPIFFPS